MSVWIAANLFYLTAGIEPLIAEPTRISELVPSLLLMTVIYFLINSGLTAIAISFEKKLPPFLVWRENFAWLSLNYFGGASLASLLVVYTRDIDFTYVAIIVPLLLVIYLTFKTATSRVEDAKQHLAQMNALYLSTIETLAMAIDAKDQVTHGHIRRVQIYASGLGREMGMTSDDEIQAIGAAALLHDMGKLAIPEHILNKPGKLTPTEFEKMKQHARIGAEILSAIDFPYPVVPVVRHHHENWDGTGYPDGIAGTDIPLGARILSVVDCFDALTSDRPYRPELPTAEAIQILRDRSGSMYDPAVVKTFIRIHESIAPTECDLASRKAIGAIMATELDKTDPQAADSPSTFRDAMDAPLLKELAAALASASTRAETCDEVAAYLKKMLPFSLCVFYLYDELQDVLVAHHACGAERARIVGLRIPIGERLTGWVAANQRSIRNSDAALDFGDLARQAEPVLLSCLSNPLIAESRLVGVLSLYADKQDAFTEDHGRIAEAVVTLASPFIRDASVTESVQPQPSEMIQSAH